MTTPKTFHCDDFNLLLRTSTSGPFIVVMQPTTVAYRMHATNAIYNLDAMVRGVLGLICHEHQGEYPGGRARQLERYARIGGAAQSWARHSIEGGKPGLAFKLLKRAWFMIMASAAQKVWHGLHRPTQSMFLPKDVKFPNKPWLRGLSKLIKTKHFHFLKPIIPRKMQILLRRRLINFFLHSHRDVWPIDPKSSGPPEDWTGWPENKKFALILTHDIDTQAGHDNCHFMAEVEKRLGFRSSFNFVAEDYQISNELINSLKVERLRNRSAWHPP